MGEDRIYRGTDNQGFPPYLKTVAGTYEYDIVAANLSCGAIVKVINGTTYTFLADIIRRVFVDTTEGGYDDTITWMSQPALYADQNPYSLQSTRLVISEVAVASMPAVDDAPPHVTFPFDPGDANTKWFVEFLWKAPRLVSESIPLMVPTDFEMAIEDYVVGYMQAVANGAKSALSTQFDRQTKARFAAHFRRSAQLQNNRVIPRPM
ncbi:MAG: hypothetical protein ABSH16_00220 [Sedimentisphaerales bacterium]